MKSYILLEVDVTENCNDGESEAVVTSKQFSFEEMLSDPLFRQELASRGWADTQALKGIDPTSLGPRLVVLHSAHSGYASGSIIDPKNAANVCNIMSHVGSFMAIELSDEVVKKVCPGGWKALQVVLATRKRFEAARQEAVAKRKLQSEEKKKLKDSRKVEDAKKLLISQGIKVGDDA